jgi:hypothetical protein
MPDVLILRDFPNGVTGARAKNRGQSLGVAQGPAKVQSPFFAYTALRGGSP